MDVVTYAAAKAYTDMRLGGSGAGSVAKEIATEFELIDELVGLGLVNPATDHEDIMFVDSNENIFVL